MKKSILLIITLFSFNKGISQQKSESDLQQKFKIGIIFGLIQPIVTNGFNIELNYFTKHFVFDYSHGFNLKLKNNLVSEESKKQNLKFKIPHTLGFGIGYRITPELNIRIEPKIHLWEVSYTNQSFQKESVFKKYSTFTMGLGAYYRLLPFKNADNFAKGISLNPSI